MNKTIASALIIATAPLCFGTAAAQAHRHHHFAPDVDAFHAVLAPVWHARPGPERTRDVCVKAGRMAALAEDIRSANATALRTAIAALKATCENQPAGVDGAFHDVHEAFHDLIGMPSAK